MGASLAQDVHVSGAHLAASVFRCAGLAASARSTAAVQRIYDIKRRQETAPLAIAAGDVHDVAAYGDVSHLPAGLLSRLLPGPVTVVLPRRADAPLSPELNPGTNTIGAARPLTVSITRWPASQAAARAVVQRMCNKPV